MKTGFRLVLKKLKAALLEVALSPPGVRALVRLITPVVVDIGLVSCIDDISLEVTKRRSASVLRKYRK